MQTMQWTVERVAEGKYRVRLGGDCLPGMILGGRGRWLVERGGVQMPNAYRTRNAAAAEIVRLAVIA